ncbi:DUF4468 domain-containing protein [Algoriphagus boritolerans]|uniref:DUF4468 domain-containing protein n=1 Tax=Algoriphagus boritolerans DSM 17298 = JCM 18970 TaxID=1120964 RepID=A0A1H5WX56_9BACT|nr:DUF4468 domain-containing protein [Algoriphagus boritolerans]SEG03875.1 protein of unknown function [Algoriphagus boritolerans DSM 17298 = JCM 18970]
MKITSFIFGIFITIFCHISHAQTSKTSTQLKEIQGLYEVDNSGNISYVNIIENLNLSEKEIYDRALSYFITKYGDANSVIQEKNEVEGRIIGKGIYPNVHSGSGLVTRVFSAVHILRIDIKEGRCRAILTLTEYDVKSYDMDGNMYPSKYPITNTYPFNPKGGEKNFHGQAFAKSHQRVELELAELERSIREGVISSETAKDDW